MTKRTVTIVTTAPANTWLYVQQNAEHIEKVQAYRDAGKLTTATTTSTVAADANDVHPLRKGQTLDVTTTVATWADSADQEAFMAWRESEGHTAAVIEYNATRGIIVSATTVDG